MVEPGTGLTILGSAIGSAKLVEKILGPTADYIGDGLKHWTHKRVENMKRIFLNAEKKLGDKLEKHGTVPPKILKGILDEGSFCDDELTAEYFGGVLASSRSEISRDDRGASYIHHISLLSAYQIRAHYIIYHIFKKIFNGTKFNPLISTDLDLMKTFIPAITVFAPSMDFSKNENMPIITSHIMFGLKRLYLVAPLILSGASKHLKSHGYNVESEGIIVSPSMLGIELFLWAYGMGNLSLFEYLNSNTSFSSIESINIPEGSKNI